MKINLITLLRLMTTYLCRIKDNAARRQENGSDNTTSCTYPTSFLLSTSTTMLFLAALICLGATAQAQLAPVLGNEIRISKWDGSNNILSSESYF